MDQNFFLILIIYVNPIIMFSISSMYSLLSRFVDEIVNRAVPEIARYAV